MTRRSSAAFVRARAEKCIFINILLLNSFCYADYADEAVEAAAAAPSVNKWGLESGLRVRASWETVERSLAWFSII